MNNIEAKRFGEGTIFDDKEVAIFSGANVEFNESSYALLYRFVLNLPKGAENVKAYVILTDHVDDLNRNQKWNNTGSRYEYEVFTDKDGKQHNQVTISGVSASEMSIRYATVYVVYTDANGNECFAYSSTLRYGVTTYLNREIYTKQREEGYSDESNKEMWVRLTMYDKLRTLAGLADYTASDEPTETPEDPTSGELTE